MFVMLPKIYSWQLRKRHHFGKHEKQTFVPSYFVTALVRILCASYISGGKQFYVETFPLFFLFPRKKAILNHVLNVWDKIRYLEEALFQTTTKKLFEKQTVSCLQRTDVNIDYGYSMSVSFSKTSSETVVES